MYELFCFCIGVLFGLCATGGINLQFPEQILCPYGGVWRFVVSHPSAIRLRKDGAPSVCRWVRGGAPGSGQVTRSPPNDPETRVPVGCGLFGSNSKNQVCGSRPSEARTVHPVVQVRVGHPPISGEDLCADGGCGGPSSPPQFVGGSGVGHPAAPKTIIGILSG